MNYLQCNITITGQESDLRLIKEWLSNDEEELAFDQVIPFEADAVSIDEGVRAAWYAHNWGSYLPLLSWCEERYAEQPAILYYEFEALACGNDSHENWAQPILIEISSKFPRCTFFISYLNEETRAYGKVCLQDAEVCAWHKDVLSDDLQQEACFVELKTNNGDTVVYNEHHQIVAIEYANGTRKSLRHFFEKDGGNANSR
jgi:hypothetical protein